MNTQAMNPTTQGTGGDAELLFSADSHVMESADFWKKNLPASLRSRAPEYAEDPKVNTFADHDGGRDPTLRVKEMATDGVSAEVLYPTRGLDQFGITDAPLQEACFRVFNEWLEEYCAAAPERLFGVACISAFDTARAVKEIERAKHEGMKGIMIWQAPPEEFAFDTAHHDPIWEAAQALDMPVSLHILCGAPFAPGVALKKRTATQFINFVLTEKLAHGMKTLVDIIASGTLDRFPKLKLVVVENEVSWMPFFISQLDKYTTGKYRTKLGVDSKVQLRPHEYFGRNIFATFFNDPPAGRMLEDWGADMWMWSNDFPHPNSTWPNSRDIIKRDMSTVSATVRAKLVRENVSRLYNVPIPSLAV